MDTTPYAAAEAHLQAADPALARLIATHGSCTLQPHSDYFMTLIRSIISQQISTKAAATIQARFFALLPDLTPAAVLALDEAALREAGLSAAKARYVRDLAAKVAAGVVDLARIDQQPDEAIIRELVQVAGIGRWTAEMFLIFSLGRLDVLPVDDLGFRTAAQRVYGLPALPDKATLAALAAPWHPFASIATWYLWRSLS
jgi:DNA-3-methyladenine glycosylase II